jgi:hypothetical protein
MREKKKAQTNSKLRKMKPQNERKNEERAEVKKLRKGRRYSKLKEDGGECVEDGKGGVTRIRKSSETMKSDRRRERTTIIALM